MRRGWGFRADGDPRHASGRLSRVAAAALIAALAGGLTVAGPRAGEAGYAALVVDADTGVILHQANADRTNYPASLTKMMTLYLAFEAIEAKRARLDDRLRVSETAAAQPPSKLGLQAGQTLSLDDAMVALATKSANDVAVVIAEHLAGSEAAFARLMTRRAHELGMTGTSYRNASGLPDDAQRTNARDISVLARAIYRDFPQYAHYFNNRSFSYHGREYRNTNRLLGVYKGMDGIKTGYINASGFNLAASVHRGGRHVIAVVLGGKTAPRRDQQMTQLLDRAFTIVDEVRWFDAHVDRPQPKPTFQLAAADGDGSLGNRLGVAAAAVGEALSDYVAIPSASAADTPAREWAIQVGAFARRDAAERALDTAAMLMPALARGSKRWIEPVVDRYGTLYRARQMGLTWDEATRACANLSRQRLPCMVAAPGS